MMEQEVKEYFENIFWSIKNRIATPKKKRKNQTGICSIKFRKKCVRFAKKEMKIL
jgi:hypothetical protein